MVFALVCAVSCGALSVRFLEEEYVDGFSLHILGELEEFARLSLALGIFGESLYVPGDHFERSRGLGQLGCRGCYGRVRVVASKREPGGRGSFDLCGRGAWQRGFDLPGGHPRAGHDLSILLPRKAEAVDSTGVAGDTGLHGAWVPPRGRGVGIPSSLGRRQVCIEDRKVAVNRFGESRLPMEGAGWDLRCQRRAKC